MSVAANLQTTDSLAVASWLNDIGPPGGGPMAGLCGLEPRAIRSGSSPSRRLGAGGRSIPMWQTALLVLAAKAGV